MGESSAHAHIARILSQWIAKRFLNGEMKYLMRDGSTSTRRNVPPKIYGYIPDAYVPRGPEKDFIIGEAKTGNDLENDHTFAQLRAFLTKCSEEDNGRFVLAVPWDQVPLARRILKTLTKDLDCSNCTMHVISENDLSGTS